MDPHRPSYHNGKESKMADVVVRYDGTLTILTPLTERAREWVRNNVDYDPWQTLGRGLRVDRRFAAVLAAGLTGAGLVVEVVE